MPAEPSSPEEPTAPADVPSATGAGPSLAHAVSWWAVRLAALGAVPWALWGLVPPLAAIAAGAALCFLCLVFLAPGDLPWRPLRPSGAAIVLWDLLLVAVLVAALFLIVPGHALLPPILLTALLVLIRLKHWIRLTGEPHHRAATGRRLRWLATGVAALLLLGLAFPLHPEPIRAAVDCALPSTAPWSGSRWADAAPPAADTDPEHLVGPARWAVPEGERVVAGHRDTVVLSGGEGFVVRAADDGRALWHVGTGRLRSVRGASLPGPEYEPGRLHQVGDTVIAEYRVPGEGEGEGDGEGPQAHGLAVGYEAATGRLRWCGRGLWNLVSDPHETARFAARDSRDGHHWGLYDAADGGLVARVAAHGGDSSAGAADPDQDRMLLGDGRATVWSGHGYSSYAVDSGERLAAVAAPVDLDRTLSGLLHVEDVTVLAFGPSASDGTGDRHRHERYLLAAHGADGAPLWDSEGTGPLAEGEPVVGSTFDQCRGQDYSFGVVSHRGFDGHFVALDGARAEQRAVVVRAEDGTVASVFDSDLFMASCSVRRYELDGRLHLGSGAVLDTGGVVRRPENPLYAELVTFTGNGVAVRTGSASTFHALP